MPNIIGDIAGNFDTLMRLLKQMPDDDTISVGDMIDRGPKSRQVLEWFKENGKAILGNHEHMMLDAIDEGGFYQRGIWQRNGGTKTLDSFDSCPAPQFIPAKAEPGLIGWVRSLPLFIKLDGALVSHSFTHAALTLEQACVINEWNDVDGNILWNREFPRRRTERKTIGGRVIETPQMQIAGHNSQFGFRRFKDSEGPFALCIDSCASGVLTGVHWPSMEVFQERISE